MNFAYTEHEVLYLRFERVINSSFLKSVTLSIYLKGSRNVCVFRGWCFSFNAVKFGLGLVWACVSREEKDE